MGLIQKYAAQGRNGDTMMAHVTPGEVVIPREVAALRPDLVAHVGDTVKRMGGDPRQLTVGAGRKNPVTGVEEFATQEEVTAAYQAQLGRAPDAGGLAYWMGQGNLSGFAAAAAPEKIQTTYQNTFGRPAEQAGVDYWASQAKGNDNYNFGTAIKAGAQGADTTARNDIAAGGVDTTKTWGNGATLSAPLAYDAVNNTWGKLPKPPAAMAASGSGVSLAGLTNWDVKPNQTVKQQSYDIIADDSPLMQQARSNSLQQMNSRGLINSSMAVGAGQKAVLDKAVEIGAQDANTYASSAQANAAAANTNSMFNTTATNTWNTNALDREQQLLLENTRNTANKDIKTLEFEFSKQAASDEQFNQQYQMYTDALYKIDMDKDLSPETKVQMKNDQANILRNYANVRNLKLDLNFLDVKTPDPATTTTAASQAQPNDFIKDGVNLSAKERELFGEPVGISAVSPERLKFRLENGMSTPRDSFGLGS